MRAKLDENLPLDAAALLRDAGWDCETLYDEGLEGAPDDAVASACQAEGRVLFTLDLDFADIRSYPPAEFIGIVVLRPAEPTRKNVLHLMLRALPVLQSSWAPRRLWIIEPERIRIREAQPADERGGP